MAFVKVDPEQNRTVAVLLVVLVLAVGAVFYRMKSTTAVKAAARPSTAVVEAMTDVVEDGIVLRTTRNPFKKPATVEVGGTSSGVRGPTVPLAASVSEIGLPLPAGRAMPWTLPVATVSPGTQEKSDTSQPDGHDAVQPTFTLLATVMSAGKSSAVLRLADSSIKVVRVGDSVDGRFKLCALTSDRAELTDGVVKVVAKRGQTDNEQPTGP